MKRLVLDADGVLADFLTHTLTILGPEAPERELIQTWDILDSLPAKWRTVVRKRWVEPGWCLSIPDMPDLPDFHALQDTEIVIATSPMPDAPHWISERTIWLGARGFQNVVFTRHKEDVPGDVMVDDKVENVESWAEHHPTGIAYLFDAPYNRHQRITHKNIIRTDSWSRILSSFR